MHIVVAVNESEPSLYAFDWMIENMLKESKSHKLSILTVVEPPVQAGYYYAASGGTKQTLRMTNIHIMITLYYIFLYCDSLYLCTYPYMYIS